jgi:hypothetical protein
LIVAAISVIVLAIAFALLLAKLTLPRHADFLPENLEALLSPKRYLPLERLLDRTDEEFLTAHPSCTRQVRRKFRKGRIRIFRSYLWELGNDFKAICHATKLSMISSPSDRSDLVRVLIKEQVRFTMLAAYVDLKLVLYGFGLSKVDAQVLIECVGAVRSQLRTLTAAPQPTLA